MVLLGFAWDCEVRGEIYAPLMREFLTEGHSGRPGVESPDLFEASRFKLSAVQVFNFNLTSCRNTRSVQIYYGSFFIAQSPMFS